MRCFPTSNAVGKQVYMEEEGPTSTIVGIVERTQVPWVESDFVENTTFTPTYIPYGTNTRFLVRTEPGRRAEVQKAAVAALERNSNRRIILRQDPFTDVRANYYRQDRSMAWLLVAVIVALPLVSLATGAGER